MKLLSSLSKTGTKKFGQTWARSGLRTGEPGELGQAWTRFGLPTGEAGPEYLAEFAEQRLVWCIHRLGRWRRTTAPQDDSVLDVELAPA